MIVFRGYNDFYEGWLCGHFVGRPPLDRKGVATESEAFMAGYHTAAETPRESRHWALVKEIECGHVTVEGIYGERRMEVWHVAEGQRLGRAHQAARRKED